MAVLLVVPLEIEVEVGFFVEEVLVVFAVLESLGELLVNSVNLLEKRLCLTFLSLLEQSDLLSRALLSLQFILFA